MELPEIDRNNYKILSDKICHYMESEHEVHPGQFEAESLLDDMLKILIPAIYNMAMGDTSRVVKAVGEKIDEKLDLRKIICVHLSPAYPS